MRKKEEPVISKVIGVALIVLAAVSLLILFDNLPRFLSSGYLISAPSEQPTIEPAAPSLPSVAPTTLEAGNKYVDDELLVKFKPGVDRSIADGLVRRYGVEKEEIPHIGVKVIKVAPQALDAVKEALKKNPAVEFAETNRLVEPSIIPNDPYYSSQWHHTKIQSPAAWDKAKATGILIGICDTGFQADHPDLYPVLRADLCYNSADGSSNCTDVHGHGTATAGIAAAATNNAIGVSGVAWGAMIIPVRISNSAGGWAYYSDAAKCINYAADNGSRVISLSYRMAGSSTIDSAGLYAQSKGAVLTVAAGNDGIDPGWPNYPGFLAVSATDNVDTLAYFSNHGAFIDISAPGVSIFTTSLGSTYSYFSGTSASSPVAAGVLGLIFGANPSFSASQAMDVLFKSAVDLNASGWDPYYGWGRVNASKAVNLALNLTSSSPDTTRPILSIISPFNASTVSNSITVAVSASDNIGVTNVELYIDGSLYATDTSSTYEFFWDTTTVSNGAHSLVAKAYDAAGNVGTSSTVSVKVSNIPDITPPTTTITSPANGTIVSGIVTVSATATDDIGVTSVELYRNSTLIGTDSSSPYSFVWNTSLSASGQYDLQSKAYDAVNKLGVSPIVTVSVDNTPPSVSITGPLITTAARKSTLTITASATDSTTSITKVEFYVNNALTCTDTTSPYSCTLKLSAAPKKTYQIVAKAYDTAGNTATSLPITVTSS